MSRRASCRHPQGERWPKSSVYLFIYFWLFNYRTQMTHIQTSKGHLRGSLRDERDLNTDPYKSRLVSLTLCMENSSPARLGKRQRTVHSPVGRETRTPFLLGTSPLNGCGLTRKIMPGEGGYRRSNPSFLLESNLVIYKSQLNRRWR